MKSNNLFPIEYRPQYFKQFLSDYLFSKVSGHTPEKRVEIELRMGRFLPTQNKMVIPDLVKQMSRQNPILFNANMLEPPSFIDQSFSRQAKFQYNFDPSIPEQSFYDLATMMKEVVPPSDRETEVSIDFIFSQGFTGQPRGRSQSTNRYTWDLNTNTFSQNAKLDKENFDILHQTYEYRLSVCHEIGQTVPFSLFDAQLKNNTLKSIRVKFRQNFTYQFMKNFFTCVWTLDNSSDQRLVLDLVKTHNPQMPAEELQSTVLALMHGSKAQNKFEIESEIVGIDVFKPYMEPKDRIFFNMLVDRFFRNFELLYMAPASFKLQSYKTYFETQFKSQSVPRPVIGAYLDQMVKKPENQ